MKPPQIAMRDPGGVFRIAWRGRDLLRWNWRAALLRRALPAPFAARHMEYSVIASTDDEVRPSERLLDLTLSALPLARRLRVEELERRMAPQSPDIPSRWPGGHYRFLAALVELLQPRCVVDVGTETGLSALALKQQLPPHGRVVTFDVVPWRDYTPTFLTEQDFADHRLVQYTEDLSHPEVMQRHHELLRQAELIFVDAAKDGVMEAKFLANLRHVPFATPPLLVLDDIRVWTMLKVWREIAHPKLDVTSFGHWTGTGLVDWLGAP